MWWGAYWVRIIGDCKVLFEFFFRRWNDIVRQLELVLIRCVNYSDGRIVFQHFLKKEAHASDWIKLHVGAQHWEIGSYRVFVLSLDRNLCRQGSFESFRLFLRSYLFKVGAGGLGGRHGGVIGIGHRPTCALVEISTGEGSGLES